MCQHEICWCVSVTVQRPVWDRAVPQVRTVSTMPSVTAASAVSSASVLERLKTIDLFSVWVCCVCVCVCVCVCRHDLQWVTTGYMTYSGCHTLLHDLQ